MDSQVAGPSHIINQDSPGLNMLRSARVAFPNNSNNVGTAKMQGNGETDMSLLCRICASTHEHLIPIFAEEGLENKLIDKIHTHLPIKMDVVEISNVFEVKAYLPNRSTTSQSKYVCSIILNDHGNAYKVDSKDSLPHHICYQCASTLLAWHDLVQCCIQSNITLLERANRLNAGKVPDTKIQVQEKSVENGSQNTRGRWPRPRLAFPPRLKRQRSLSPVSRTPSPFDPPQECESPVNVGLASEDDLEQNPPEELRQKNLTQNEDNTCERKRNLDDLPGNFLKDLYGVLINFKAHYETYHIANGGERPNDENIINNIRNNSDDAHSDSADRGDETSDAIRKATPARRRPNLYNEEATAAIRKAERTTEGQHFYQCPDCGKIFRTANTFVQHWRIHSGERPCVCHLCGKQFRIEGGLHRHLQETHLRLKTHTCDTCGAKFVNAQNLLQHVRIHTGERPYVCSKCGKRFKQSGSLYIHNKTHTDHFPHACTTCDAKYRSRAELIHHVLKHTGEKPNVCEVCGKAFRIKHDLNRHVLVHTGEKPYSCNDCGVAFRQRRYLRNHLKKNHSHLVS